MRSYAAVQQISNWGDSHEGDLFTTVSTLFMTDELGWGPRILRDLTVKKVLNFGIIL
ncbi:hypothetical protein BCR33DRAFT_721324 [Rhizoclosmatium globosum]|uniref:Uncharacterized protein n=1 Tax=Rhizoclosmatium globosum TaxID=329046 RepID=A0A1Y2BS49_9FUNG|nr:hypothetical protein BCR33DRAFT_721324 [Rhizoclosmatium globosum]|eukprot:ORY37576.1 hypothetical protein BCR33DRAFT_721324 [Rhizoclosmatium globosum]